MGGIKQLGICFIMFRAYPVFNTETNQAFGGSELELYNLAVWFARFEQFKVDFIVGDYGQKDIETFNKITVRRVKYMREDVFRSFRHKVLRYFYFFWSMLRQPSHIYITKTASEHLGWMVLFLKFLKGKKVVFRLGSDKDAEFEFWKDSPRLYHLYKFGLRNSDLIYVQSEDQKRMLKDNCGMESKVVKNIFPVGNGRCLHSKDYILWVSRCDPLKRPELFLELARKMPDEKFMMIMPHIRKVEDSGSDYENRLTAAGQKAAEELGNFEFHEFVPFYQIQSYYDNARLFINTSEYEGFPNSFIQSCIGKTGILSFRVNPDEFLTKYSLGYCCEDNLEKAIDFIKRLDGQMIWQLGENAYDYVKKNHDVSGIGKAYMEDFMKLARREAGERCCS